MRPRYNGAPGQQHWVIRQHPETGARHLDRLWWGLIPFWTKEASPKLKPINARAERVASAPMFRAAYAKRRCPGADRQLLRMDEDAGQGPKQPYAIGMANGEPFALAGIWEGWRHPETDEMSRTFCIITTAANELIAPIHDRMPVIVAPEDFDRWLAPSSPTRAICSRPIRPRRWRCGRCRSGSTAPSTTMPAILERVA